MSRLLKITRDVDRITVGLWKFRFSLTLRNRQTQRRIDHAPILHLMFNDKFNAPFCDFLNRHFSPKEHLVIYKKCTPGFPMPDAENVLAVTKVTKYRYDSPTLKKIICHSLCLSEFETLFYEHPDLLKKAYWVIWGGDLYDAEKTRKKDFVRKHFAGYFGAIDRDYAVAKYGMKGPFFDTFNAIPVDFNVLGAVVDTPRSRIQVQVNNSCDKSTLAMLDILAKFRDRGIYVTTVVSYGDLEYKEAILAKGRTLFGDRFLPVETYLSPEQYAAHLAQNAILVMNQDRQQGIGNIVASLFLGQKVYVRSSISIGRYLRERDMAIYLTEDIPHATFEEFCANAAVAQNQAGIQELFGEPSYVRRWQEAFGAIRRVGE